MPLNVIGAGFPRTGTKSLQLALNELGFGPCHHMSEIFPHPDQALLWTRKYSGEALDWDEVLKGYSSLTDAPGCFAWRELADRYPNAKVILSIRSPESWWKSASSTVMSPQIRAATTDSNSPLGANVFQMFQAMSSYMEKAQGAGWTGMSENEKDAIAAFERHNESVRKTIKPERLLVFEAKQGWQPLCKFLGVPVPDKPYPRVNSTEDFITRRNNAPRAS